MRRSDSRTGQDGHRELRNHRHVDRDSVALLNASLLQHVGKAADLRVQFGVGENATIAGLPFPDDGALAGSNRIDVLIETDSRGVELATAKPLRVGLVRPIEHLVERLHPRDLATDAAEEALRVLDGLLVHALVRRHVGDARRLLEFGGREKDAVLVEDVFDRTHAEILMLRTIQISALEPGSLKRAS